MKNAIENTIQYMPPGYFQLKIYYVYSIYELYGSYSSYGICNILQFLLIK
jgi:hypothetical protein